MWIHTGLDQFVLLPASILRRHQVFIGQGASGKVVPTCISTTASLPRRPTRRWKELCEPYVCSWSDSNVKANIMDILSHTDLEKKHTS